MKKRIFIRILLWTAAVMATVSAMAEGERPFRDGAYLRQLQERDSVLIGDQLAYGFRLEGLAEGTPFALQDFSQGFLDGVVIVRDWQIDTLRAKDGTYTLDASLLITSFDEGIYTLPPLSVLTADPATLLPDTLVFRPEILDVKTLPIDEETYVPHDIRPQIGYPVTFREVLPWLLGVLLAVLAGFGIYFLVRRLVRSGKDAAPGDPAHIVALRRLDRYRNSRFWAPEKQKEFYSGVTDALREYIAVRYETPAMEQTTDEMFAALRDADIPEDLRGELKQLFEVSDFVKFARMTVGDEDNARVVPFAVKFVTGTYQAEPEKEEENVL